MKAELLKLRKVYNIPTKINNLDKLKHYLRNTFNINVNVGHSTFSQTYHYSITGPYDKDNNGQLYGSRFSKFKTYELALEDGIINGIKLIKK